MRQSPQGAEPHRRDGWQMQDPKLNVGLAEAYELVRDSTKVTGAAINWEKCAPVTGPAELSQELSKPVTTQNTRNIGSTEPLH